MEDFLLKAVSLTSDDTFKHYSNNSDKRSRYYVSVVKEGDVRSVNPFGLKERNKNCNDIIVKRVYVNGGSLSNKYSLYNKVGWVINHKQNNCLICFTSFGLLKRKHHCRACGNLICDSCSSHKRFIEKMEDKLGRVRVCKECVSLNKSKKSCRVLETLDDWGKVVLSNNEMISSNSNNKENKEDTEQTTSRLPDK